MTPRQHELMSAFTGIIRQDQVIQTLDLMARMVHFHRASAGEIEWCVEHVSQHMRVTQACIGTVHYVFFEGEKH